MKSFQYMAGAHALALQGIGRTLDEGNQDVTRAMSLAPQHGIDGPSGLHKRQLLCRRGSLELNSGITGI